MTIDYNYVQLPKRPDPADYKSLAEYHADVALHRYLWSKAGELRRMLSPIARQYLPIRKVLPAVVSFRVLCPLCNKHWHPISTISVKNAPGGGLDARRFLCKFGERHTCSSYAEVRLEYKEYTNELTVKLEGAVSITDVYFREIQSTVK